MIMREARVVLVAKFLELFRVIDFDPARSVNLHRLEHRLDLVLVTQAVLHHIELQHTDGAEDDVVAHDRSVNLSGALFGTLVESSEEHTSELQSLMRISSAVFCLKK